nr:MAG TPA: hypothetical protein [Caudoviricetes sp.]
MITMAFITINQQEFNPASCQFEYETLDGENAGRTLDGTMHRDVVSTKIKINLEWNSITVSEMSRLLTALDSPFFTVRYFNPQRGGFVTDTFYCGNRSVPVYSFINNQIKYNSGFTVNLIQR